MPQCKRDGCREPAVDHRVKTEGFKRKQYCARHYEEYKAKGREAAARRRAAPKCNMCGKEPLVSEHQVSTGLCRGCEELCAEEHREMVRRYEFQAADTVQKLKNWIEEYML